MLEMDELLIIKVESTATWRQEMASRHPGDAARNLTAAEALSQLAEELRSLSGTPQHQQLDAILTSDVDSVAAFDTIISDATRAIGFRKTPQPGSEFLQELLVALDDERRAKNLPLPVADAGSELGPIRSPRFPEGILLPALRTQPLHIQKETMVCWLVENHAPVDDSTVLFGFGEAASSQPSAVLNTSPLNTFTLNQGPRIGGFGEGVFFTGERPLDLLTKAFGPTIATETIEQVASAFDGLWNLKPTRQSLDAATTAAEAQAQLSQALNEFEEKFEQIAPKHGGIGHNRPPEDEVITEDEEVVILRALGHMRLAPPPDTRPSVFGEIWSSVSGVIESVGKWILNKINLFLDPLMQEAGKSIGKAAPYLLLSAIGLYSGALHINDIIQFLTHKLP